MSDERLRELERRAGAGNMEAWYALERESILQGRGCEFRFHDYERLGRRHGLLMRCVVCDLVVPVAGPDYDIAATEAFAQSLFPSDNFGSDSAR